MRASVCMTAKGMGAMDRYQRNGAGSGARTRTALRLDQAWLGQPSPTAALLRHAALGDNRRLSATRRVTRFAAALLTATALTEAPAWAVDVSTETQLRSAIFAANGGGDSSINITGNITLTQSLPMITSNVTVTGNGNTLNANMPAALSSLRPARRRSPTSRSTMPWRKAAQAVPARKAAAADWAPAQQCS